MRSGAGRVGVLLVGLLAVTACAPGAPPGPDATPSAPPRPLPDPMPTEPGSLEEAIAERRSVRELVDRPLSDAQIGQLLWSAQGITGSRGRRAAPSAGATYPLEVYVATAEGVARYEIADHALSDHLDDDRRSALAAAAFGQEWIADAGAVVVLTGVVERTAGRYDDRAERYVLLEAGHAAQNVLLQATALDLVGVPVGAFDDDDVRQVLALPTEEQPLYLLPIGFAAD
ncbi:MAG: SagB/ThcOx family dehydrogenase [Nitriliruptor sp.]|nr:MAG: SagB/ThcOx family dehydrogenase [Nitriliruptor sp.]